MTKRINSPELLPPWFQLEKYQALLDLTGREFLEQMEIRKFTLLMLELYGVDDDGGAECGDYIDEILSGEVVIKGGIGYHIPHEDKTQNGDRPRLNQSDSIMPLYYAELWMMDAQARRNGIYKADPSSFLEQGSIDRYDDLLIRSDFILSSVSIPVNEDDTACDVIATILLDESTDEEILANLKNLLPKWRKQLSIPEPVFEKPRVGESTLPKIMSDCLIPAMDLMIWELLEGAKITQALLERTLFPDSLRSSVMQTLRRGIKTIRDNGHERAFKTYLDNNPEQYDRKMSDNMALYIK
ncbi:MAG: hypothetical protein H9917_07645 [Candidatus Oceanisphaera merdipullorum]|nr:hypothetical protein [Candidatus Oceanisphaera merdipullorum]